MKVEKLSVPKGAEGARSEQSGPVNANHSVDLTFRLNQIANVVSSWINARLARRCQESSLAGRWFDEREGSGPGGSSEPSRVLAPSAGPPMSPSPEPGSGFAGGAHAHDGQ